MHRLPPKFSWVRAIVVVIIVSLKVSWPRTSFHRWNRSFDPKISISTSPNGKHQIYFHHKFSIWLSLVSRILFSCFCCIAFVVSSRPKRPYRWTLENILNVYFKNVPQQTPASKQPTNQRNDLIHQANKQTNSSDSQPASQSVSRYSHFLFLWQTEGVVQQCGPTKFVYYWRRSLQRQRSFGGLLWPEKKKKSEIFESIAEGL